MILRLATLKEGENQIRETVQPSDYDLNPEVFDSPIKIDGIVDFGDTMLDVRLNVSTAGKYHCDRCAIDFVRPFELNVRVHVMRRDPEDQDEAETEGLLFIGAHGTEFNLSDEIVDAIFLDLPIQVLCRQDCKGLCMRCGADLNEDPFVCLLPEKEQHNCIQRQQEEE